MTYSDKLKDPRWQKKRLEVLQERMWTCEACGNMDNTLHVHHGYYETGKDPWDYNSAFLHVLCEQCHKERHARELAFKMQVAVMPDVEFKLLMALVDSLYELGTHQRADFLMAFKDIAKATLLLVPVCPGEPITSHA